MTTLFFLAGAYFLLAACFAVHCVEEFVSTKDSTPLRRRSQAPRA